MGCCNLLALLLEGCCLGASDCLACVLGGCNLLTLLGCCNLLALLLEGCCNLLALLIEDFTTVGALSCFWGFCGASGGASEVIIFFLATCCGFIVFLFGRWVLLDAGLLGFCSGCSVTWQACWSVSGFSSGFSSNIASSGSSFPLVSSFSNHSTVQQCFDKSSREITAWCTRPLLLLM